MFFHLHTELEHLQASDTLFTHAKRHANAVHGIEKRDYFFRLADTRLVREDSGSRRRS